MLNPVKHNSACAQHTGGEIRLYTPPHYGTDARQQHPRAEGFGHIIICAELQPKHFILILNARSEQNYGCCLLCP
jgi:putative aminopeptidase FrvX